MATLAASDYTIKPIDIETARTLVEAWHYAKGGSKQATYLFGLFPVDSDVPCGVSWWLPPAKGSVDKYNPGGHKTTLSLHRLVIEPGRPTNAASYLIGRSIRYIAQEGRFDFLITYADTWQNHTGIIYRATNWRYEGLSDPTRVFANPEGKTASSKNGSGGAYSAETMATKGYVCLGYFPKHVYTMRLPKVKRLHRGLKVKRPQPDQLVWYLDVA